MLQQQQRGKSNFIQTSHRSNQMPNWQKQSLAKATTPISIPKENSTSHNMPTNDEKIDPARRHQLD